MKKTQKKLGAFLLCATLAAFTVGCQKETIEEPIVREAQIGEERTVSYSIDGSNFTIKLYGDDAWNAFVHRMVAMSKEGHRVSFRVGNFSLCCFPNSIKRAPQTSVGTGTMSSAYPIYKRYPHDPIKFPMTVVARTHIQKNLINICSEP